MRSVLELILVYSLKSVPFHYKIYIFWSFNLIHDFLTFLNLFSLNNNKTTKDFLFSNYLFIIYMIELSIY